MLSAKEFTVGSLADASPLSLVLPRGRYEATALIGRVKSGPAAVFLDGDFKFGFFESSGAENWRGLIIPNVNVEMDEDSLFDPQSDLPSLGALVRTGTQLVIQAKGQNSFGRSSPVVLEDGLAPTNGLAAAFSRWRVVIGEDEDKRLLFEVDVGQKSGT